jgi:hypothetical protein
MRGNGIQGRITWKQEQHSISEIFIIHHSQLINHTSTMSAVNAQASSSKPQRKRQEHVKWKGRGGKMVQQPRVKSNQAKRQQGDEELRDLQARIDAFVRDPSPSLNVTDW